MIKSNKIGIIGLIGILFGSVVGSGVYTLPSSITHIASPVPALIAWLISGAGVLLLGITFQKLSMERSDLPYGIMSHAHIGFGKLAGSLNAYGYWFASIVSNVAYFMIIFSTLIIILPSIDMSSTTKLIVLSSLCWLVHLICMLGVSNTTIINTILNIIKLIPLLSLIILGIVFFDPEIYKYNTSPDLIHKLNLGSFFTQIKGVMLLTVWSFLGIEGASVLTSRARKRSYIGYSTLLGVILILLTYMGITFATFVLSKSDITANLNNPSLPKLLEIFIPHYMLIIIDIIFIISIISCLISWTLLASEIMITASWSKLIPSWIGKDSIYQSSNALWCTTLISQIGIVFICYTESTFLTIALLASSIYLVPYLFSTLFFLKHRFTQNNGSLRFLIVPALACIYNIWLFYAAGIKYLFLSIFIYITGLPLYYYRNKKIGKLLKEKN